MEISICTCGWKFPFVTRPKSIINGWSQCPIFGGPLSCHVGAISRKLGLLKKWYSLTTGKGTKGDPICSHPKSPDPFKRVTLH